MGARNPRTAALTSGSTTSPSVLSASCNKTIGILLGGSAEGSHYGCVTLGSLCIISFSSLQCIARVYLHEEGLSAAWIGLRAVVCLGPGRSCAGLPSWPAQARESSAQFFQEISWGGMFQYPFPVRAYELAAKVPSVIHQLPRHCSYPRIRHSSLHSCFESTHARCAGRRFSMLANRPNGIRRWPRFASALSRESGRRLSWSRRPSGTRETRGFCLAS